MAELKQANCWSPRVAESRPGLDAARTVVLAILIFLRPSLQAQTFTVLHVFAGGTDGRNPMAGLVLDGSGNLYGTTEVGGNSDNCDLTGPGCGTVYEIDTDGNETILHRFTGQQSNDGAYPTDALIFGADGDLYGTTYAGGAANSGTVFTMAPSGQVTVLHSFNTRDVSDGTFPSGGLIMDADGTIYGTTQEGGSSDSCWGGCGVVFKLDRAAAGNERVLLSFAPPAAYPVAPLTLGATGHLYGTTGGSGDGSSLGTVFELHKDMAVPPRTLYTFDGGADGDTPRGAVVRDAEGRLYGTAFSSGNFNCTYGDGYGCGLVYELTPEGKEIVLHAFTGPEGAFPSGGLLRDSSRNLYGTTAVGGAFGFGTVFKLDKHRKITVLHSFDGSDGRDPVSALVQDRAGNLYGTTYWGGDLNCEAPYGCGVVFKLSPQ